jgi:hypothetical protein
MSERTKRFSAITPLYVESSDEDGGGEEFDCDEDFLVACEEAEAEANLDPVLDSEDEETLPSSSRAEPTSRPATTKNGMLN